MLLFPGRFSDLSCEVPRCVSSSSWLPRSSRSVCYLPILLAGGQWSIQGTGSQQGKWEGQSIDHHWPIGNYNESELVKDRLTTEYCVRENCHWPLNLNLNRTESLKSITSRKWSLSYACIVLRHCWVKCTARTQLRMTAGLRLTFDRSVHRLGVWHPLSGC